MCPHLGWLTPGSDAGSRGTRTPGWAASGHQRSGPAPEREPPPSQDLIWEPPSQGRGLGASLARGRGMGGVPFQGRGLGDPLPADVVGKGGVRFQRRDLGAPFRGSRARQRSPTSARGVPWLPLSSQKVGGGTPHCVRRSSRPASGPSPSGSS